MDSLSELTMGSADSPPRIELVLQNTRQNGTRIPIEGPLTLLGRSPKCEIQLDVEGIQSFHSALIDGPEGLELRDLSSEGLESSKLVDGDQFTIGSFLFQVAINDSLAADATDRASLSRAQTAVRIQAAAVAAQQAGLDEEEQRLNQQQVALDQQQEQLAKHLEERRLELEEMWNDLSAEREETEAERGRVQQEMTEVKKEKGVLRSSLQEVEKEKARLQSINEKQHQRNERQRQDQEAHARHQEMELQSALERVRREKESLQRNRAELNAARLAFNGDAEIARCQLREAWESVTHAQQELAQRLKQEQQERDRLNHDLQERKRVIELAEQSHSIEIAAKQKQRAELEKEVVGLETRAKNLRAKLVADEKLSRPSMVSSPAFAAPVPVMPRLVLPVPKRIEQIAGTLIDHRLHLLEQWQSLVKIHEQWRQERDALIQELALEGQKLADREQKILGREESLDKRDKELRHRAENLAQIRLVHEKKQSQLQMSYASRQAEAETLKADIESREAALAARDLRFGKWRRKIARGRSRDLERVQSAIETQATARRQFLTILEQYQLRDIEIVDARRAVISEALALERFRLECVGLLDDAAMAEKKIDRLRAEEEQQLNKAYDELHRQRQQLIFEADLFAERAGDIDQQLADIAEREVKLRQGRETLQSHRVSESAANRLRDLELRRLRMQNNQATRQIEFLKGEVERIAGLVLGVEETELQLTTTQAA